MAHEIDRIRDAIAAVVAGGRRGILVTVIGTRGSTYRRAGARAVIAENGETFGTVSGGCLERDLAERIAPWLAAFEPRCIVYDSSADSDVVFGLGLGCRGVIEMLVEPFDAAHLPPLATDFAWNGREPVRWTTSFEGRELLTESIQPQRQIVVFGGADAAAVARQAEIVGWRATVVAPRDVHPDDVAGTFDLSAFDAAVVMTHSFLHDQTLLAAVLPSPIEYVALLGPRQRGEELIAALPQFDEAWRAKLHNPAGIDLGAETPEEIALSIIAEAEIVVKRRSGRSLRESDQPIHERADRRLTGDRDGQRSATRQVTSDE